METKNKKHKGVTIVVATDPSWMRHSLVSIVEGKTATMHCSFARAKRLIDKALTSDRVTVVGGQMVFPTSHDYFALAEAETKPMPTAAQVARMEELYARHFKR